MATRSVHLALHIHDSQKAMAERAAGIFATACQSAVAARGIFRVAVSGGKTPVPLFRLLAGGDWVERLPWEKMAFFWVDERSVGPDHPESNFGMAKAELFDHAPATRFYRMRGEANVVSEAERYERLLADEFKLAAHEKPRFDLVLLGMGADGHTASIFPDSPLMGEINRLAADVYVPKLQEDRVSLTLPVINNARLCMFLVSGADKHPALSQALNILDQPRLPAQFVRPSAGELIWIVDEKAALGK